MGEELVVCGKAVEPSHHRGSDLQTPCKRFKTWAAQHWGEPQLPPQGWMLPQMLLDTGRPLRHGTESTAALTTCVDGYWDLCEAQRAMRAGHCTALSTRGTGRGPHFSEYRLYHQGLALPVSPSQHPSPGYRRRVINKAVGAS